MPLAVEIVPPHTEEETVGTIVVVGGGVVVGVVGGVVVGVVGGGGGEVVGMATDWKEHLNPLREELWLGPE